MGSQNWLGISQDDFVWLGRFFSWSLYLETPEPGTINKCSVKYQYEANCFFTFPANSQASFQTPLAPDEAVDIPMCTNWALGCTG